MSPDAATEHFAREIREAADELLKQAGQNPGGLPAYELKIRARNGWSAGAMNLALNRLIDTGQLELQGDLIRPPH